MHSLIILSFIRHILKIITKLLNKNVDYILQFEDYKVMTSGSTSRNYVE
jgi:hypothetical protein